ncbi:MAG: hypothetical protein ACFB9N_08685 [Geitlerinemataceae cyanobacterium]
MNSELETLQIEDRELTLITGFDKSARAYFKAFDLLFDRAQSVRQKLASLPKAFDFLIVALIANTIITAAATAFLAIPLWLLAIVLSYEFFGWLFLARLFGICFVAILLFELANSYGKLYRVRDSGLLSLLAEVEKHHQIIANIHTLDRLAEVGNAVGLGDREAAIDALAASRERLIRALKTEKILRDRPEFRPQNFDRELGNLNAARLTTRATEYAQLLDDALSLGVSVERELEALSDPDSPPP